MPFSFAAVAAVVVVACAVAAGQAPSAVADPVAVPPFIDHTQWSHWGGLSSLHVYPTAEGRRAAGEFNEDTQGQEAWTEVLRLAPDADTPGMRAQFLCHWAFAEKVEPGKTSWNLEPWRPVVSDQTMVDTRCNPGGPQEPS